MNLSRKKIIFLSIDLAAIALLVLLDQFTKRLAVLHLKGKDPYVLINGALELRYLENHGAAFGLLQNQKIFFIVIASLILLVIGYVLFRMPVEKRYDLLQVLLTLIAAGALGNLIDRVRTDYVVDFIYFSLIDFPVFNVADIYVTVSTFLFVIALMFYYKEQDFVFMSINPGNKYREM